MTWLIDDGVEDRGHRHNLLRGCWVYGGVSIGAHPGPVSHKVVGLFASDYDAPGEDEVRTADSSLALPASRASHVSHVSCLCGVVCWVGLGGRRLLPSSFGMLPTSWTRTPCLLRSTRSAAIPAPMCPCCKPGWMQLTNGRCCTCPIHCRSWYVCVRARACVCVAV